MRLLPLLLLCAVSARAQLFEGSPKFSPLRISMALLPNAVPIGPLDAGRWTGFLAPAYGAFKHEERGHVEHEHAWGFGGAGGAVYAVSEKVAVSVIGLGYAHSGDSSLVYEGAAVAPGEVEDKGPGIAALVSYDPSPWAGVRLPVLVGAGYFDLEQEGTIAGTISAGTLAASRSFQGLLPVFGVAPQFDIREKYVFSPYVFTTLNVDVDAACAGTGAGATGCAASRPGIDDEAAAGGFTLVYRPWNFAFVYTLPFDSAAGYSFRFQKTF